MTQLPQPIEAWAARHRPLLTAFGTVLSFAVLFAGTALAAYHSGEADATAVLCGLAAILFTRLYVMIVQRIARSIDARRSPKPDDAAKPGGIPRWASFPPMLGVRWDRIRPGEHCDNRILRRVARRVLHAELSLAAAARPQAAALDVIDPWLDALAPTLQLRRLGYR